MLLNLRVSQLYKLFAPFFKLLPLRFNFLLSLLQLPFLRVKLFGAVFDGIESGVKVSLEFFPLKSKRKEEACS
jgi:hypothetical protein